MAWCVVPGSLASRDLVMFEPFAAKDYGSRSSTAMPLWGSNGTELCSCATRHLPPTLRQHTVARHYITSSPPPTFVPLTRLRLWQ